MPLPRRCRRTRRDGGHRPDVPERAMAFSRAWASAWRAMPLRSIQCCTARAFAHVGKWNTKALILAPSSQYRGGQHCPCRWPKAPQSFPARVSTTNGRDAILSSGAQKTESPSRGRSMKGAVAAAVVVALLPCTGQAQSWFTPGPTLGGFYVGLESGTTWFLNNNGYSMNTGWTTGAFVGYEFPWGIRAEFSGTYRANTGTGPGQVPTLVDTNPTTTTPTITTPATTTPATTTPPTT